MSTISALPRNIVEWLETREELKEIKFLVEFPAIKKAVPLKNTIVAVGIGGVDIVDSFVENDEGVLVENEYCRQANMRLRLSIHAPYSEGGEACHRAFTDIIDCLTFASGLDIISSGCDRIEADRDTDAFVLAAWISVKASLCPAETSDLDFPSFINKELLCGSHINDTRVHLSEEEKNYLISPYDSGSYFGTGSASRTISLGFRPSLVVVTANGLPMFYYDKTDSTNYTLSGVAFDGGQSIGVKITNNGFEVRTGDSISARNSYPRLNESGITYVYIAYK